MQAKTETRVEGNRSCQCAAVWAAESWARGRPQGCASCDNSGAGEGLASQQALAQVKATPQRPGPGAPPALESAVGAGAGAVCRT